MLNNIFQPYHTMQEMNLDWILTKVKNILRFVPDDGAVGQILRRTAHGAEWSNEQGGGGAVDSVNGQTGTVVLTASDVGALPDTYVAPVTSVNGQTGTVVLGKSDIGLGNVDNVQQYSATNPPPYPVTSVNSQTGAVSLAIPTDTGDLTNGAGYVTAAGAAAAAPVQSVNGQTGTVTVGTLTRTLLWTNPGTNLGAVTINLDMSGYDYIEIECTETGNYPQRAYFVKCEIGTSATPAQETLTTFYFNRDLSGYGALGVMSRYADIYSDRIVFTSGDMLYNGSYYQNWDGRAVPYKIWGIKY